MDKLVYCTTCGHERGYHSHIDETTTNCTRVGCTCFRFVSADLPVEEEIQYVKKQLKKNSKRKAKILHKIEELSNELSQLEVTYKEFKNYLRILEKGD